MKRNRIFLILLSFILLTSTVFASSKDGFQVIEPSREFYVYDDNNIIDQELKDYIIDINKKLFQETGAQVVVASVSDISNIAKEAYALKVFEKWEIGSQGKDNGILILILANQGEIWIETGYGLEGAFPDSLQKRIIEEEMIPSFKEGDYNRGIERGFNRIISRIEEEYEIDIDGLTTNSSQEEGVFSWGMVGLILAFFFIDIVFFRGRFLYMLSRASSRSYYRGPRGGGPPYGGYGGGPGNNSGGGSSGGGGRSGGGGAGGSW